MEDVADRPERLRLDRVDQRAHPGAQARGPGDALRGALAALGAVLGGAALGRVDDGSGEQSIAGGGEVARLGERLEAGEEVGVEMGLGEVEMEAGKVEGEARKPVRLGGEEVGEGSRFGRLDRLPRPGSRPWPRS